MLYIPYIRGSHKVIYTYEPSLCIVWCVMAHMIHSLVSYGVNLNFLTWFLYRFYSVSSWFWLQLIFNYVRIYFINLMIFLLRNTDALLFDSWCKWTLVSWNFMSCIPELWAWFQIFMIIINKLFNFVDWVGY